MPTTCTSLHSPLLPRSTFRDTSSAQPLYDAAPLRSTEFGGADCMTRGRLMSGRFHQHGRATHGTRRRNATEHCCPPMRLCGSPCCSVFVQPRPQGRRRSNGISGRQPIIEARDSGHRTTKLWGTPRHEVKDRELPLAGVFYFSSRTAQHLDVRDLRPVTLLCLPARLGSNRSLTQVVFNTSTVSLFKHRRQSSPHGTGFLPPLASTDSSSKLNQATNNQTTKQSLFSNTKAKWSAAP